ncbi:ATP-binding protein [Rhodobacter sp. NTK016B]|uniref:AAA family ATPase n=1 Tax=Rhodobacter sp. NTK016B TaxID=2759676 RepID=UPI001A8C4693|nr:ATP-binding protein [Rhodobacter sp. NTK016B]MBN8294707.1 ATP-binding protein [Rhodobacter sp. NTK016B]
MDGAANTHAVGNVAPLRNVMLLNALINRVQNRDYDLPGLACFFGPSGYGKTKAAVWNAQETRAYWVEVKSTWSRKKFAEMILRSMGIAPARTIGDMVEQIGDQLSRSERPLLIDEADLVAKDGMIGVIRDIYESSQGTVILIGEENLPQTLRKWERVHNRMLDWVAAQPADIREVGLLARMKCPGIEIEPDVQQLVLQKSQARARRIVVNLRQIAEYSLSTGAKRITLAEAKKITFFSGEAPTPRRML